jgi:hypothetical protein
MKLKLTPAELRVVRRVARLGGIARAKKLTHAELSAIGVKGAYAKWAKRRAQMEYEMAATAASGSGR